MTTYEYLLDRKNNNLPVVPERIVCAANMFEDGTIVLGVRHSCEIMHASAKKMGILAFYVQNKASTQIGNALSLVKKQ